jgi:hypothetical protein
MIQQKVVFMRTTYTKLIKKLKHRFLDTPVGDNVELSSMAIAHAVRIIHRFAPSKRATFSIVALAELTGTSATLLNATMGHEVTRPKVFKTLQDAVGVTKSGLLDDLSLTEPEEKKFVEAYAALSSGQSAQTIKYVNHMRLFTNFVILISLLGGLGQTIENIIFGKIDKSEDSLFSILFSLLFLAAAFVCLYYLNVSRVEFAEVQHKIKTFQDVTKRIVEVHSDEVMPKTLAAFKAVSLLPNNPAFSVTLLTAVFNNYQAKKIDAQNKMAHYGSQEVSILGRIENSLNVFLDDLIAFLNHYELNSGEKLTKNILDNVKLLLMQSVAELKQVKDILQVSVDGADHLVKRAKEGFVNSFNALPSASFFCANEATLPGEVMSKRARQVALFKRKFKEQYSEGVIKNVTGKVLDYKKYKKLIEQEQKMICDNEQACVKIRGR